MQKKDPIQLTDEQIEELVERVTERVIENVYLSIGRSVVKKFFWIVGVASLAVLTWLASAGHIKP
jgi:hypothetical protein